MLVDEAYICTYVHMNITILEQIADPHNLHLDSAESMRAQEVGGGVTPRAGYRDLSWI